MRSQIQVSKKHCALAYFLESMCLFLITSGKFKSFIPGFCAPRDGWYRVPRIQGIGPEATTAQAPGHFMTAATLVSVPCSIFWQGWDLVVDHSPMPFWFVPLHQGASFLRAGCPSCFLGTHKAPSFPDPKNLSSQPCCLPKAHCLSASLQGVKIPEARQ